MQDAATQINRYSKEELLFLRFSALSTKKTENYDWCYIYSIIPNPTEDHHKRRINSNTLETIGWYHRVSASFYK